MSIEALAAAREAVAMAAQRIGDADGDAVAALVTAWAAHPDPLVQRAAVAGRAGAVGDVLEVVTEEPPALAPGSPASPTTPP